MESKNDIAVTPDDNLKEQLRMLHEAFVAKLPARIDAMKQAMLQWRSDGDMAQLALLHRLLHSLAGAAGSFGLAATGQEARRLEVVVGSWLAKKHCTDEELDEMKTFLHRLRGMHASVPMQEAHSMTPLSLSR